MVTKINNMVNKHILMDIKQAITNHNTILRCTVLTIVTGKVRVSLSHKKERLKLQKNINMFLKHL